MALTKQLVDDHDCCVYMGSRIAERGEMEIDELYKTKPERIGKVGLVNIDVTSKESIAKAAKSVKK